MSKKKEPETSVEGSEYWQEFRAVEYVRAKQNADGTYLVHGSRGDVWEVQQQDFHNRYKPVTPNKS
jgi:hypothetical protein